MYCMVFSGVTTLYNLHISKASHNILIVKMFSSVYSGVYMTYTGGIHARLMIIFCSDLAITADISSNIDPLLWLMLIHLRAANCGLAMVPNK